VKRKATQTNVKNSGLSSIGESRFDVYLKEQKCDFKTKNIAIAGSTASEWYSGSYLEDLKKNAANHDYLWLTLMGNDALAQMPSCASEGHTPEECGDELEKDMLNKMGTILDDLHEVNPNLQIVGFGYDTMFGGLGCEVLCRTIFPQCWKESNVTSPIECFNTQFIRIQGIWDKLASARSDYVTAINILGTTQMAGGDEGVTIGHPDMTKLGPSAYWPDYYGCIHPSLLSTKHDGSGAMLIMHQFYEQYWSKTLGC
jgi:hypothetical protein